MSKERRKNEEGIIKALLTEIEGEEKKTFKTKDELRKSMRKVRKSINEARVSTTDDNFDTFNDFDVPDFKVFLNDPKVSPKVSKTTSSKTAVLDTAVALLNQVTSYKETLEGIQGQLRQVLKDIKDSKPAKILQDASKKLQAKLKF